MIVTTPFLAELRELFPAVQVDVLCSSLNRSVLDRNPNISSAIPWAPSLRGFIRLFKMRRRYDLLVDLNHSVIWRDLVLIRLLDPVWVASTYKEGRYGVTGKSLPLYQLMPNSECSWSRSITSKYLNLIEHLGGCPERDYRYRLYYQTRPGHVFLHRFSTVAQEKDKKVPYWIVNQRGGRESMALEIDHMQAVIRILLDSDPQTQVLWATSPTNYQETWAYKLKWFAKDDRVQVYKPTRDPMDICAFMNGAKGLISPDTSLAHMAAAFGVPSVVVFAAERDLYEQWKAPTWTWQRHLFSKDSKSLQGYDGDSLKRATVDLVAAAK